MNLRNLGSPQEWIADTLLALGIVCLAPMLPYIALILSVLFDGPPH